MGLHSEPHKLKVVELLMTDSPGVRFAIETAPNVYWGQKWILHEKFHARSYPSWVTREKAETKLKELKSETISSAPPKKDHSYIY